MSRTSLDPQYNWRLKEWFPDLSETIHKQFKTYFIELIKQSKTHNVVPSKSLYNADLLHFADSIKSMNIVHEKVNSNKYLYDIGSGAGFPGMVYAILYPEQDMVLIEPDEHKSKFLENLVKSLELKNVRVENRKVENMSVDCIEQGICRDFLPLPLALLTLRKQVQKGGVVFHVKTDQWSIEVSDIPSQLCSSWQPGLEKNYLLPISDVKLYVVRTDKIN